MGLALFSLKRTFRVRDQCQCFPEGFYYSGKFGGEIISELFYYHPSSPAINGPEIAVPLPPASHITINRYAHEHHDDGWSEGLAGKNVFPFCSENSSQVSTPSPHQHVWLTRASGTLWRTVVCVVFVFSVSDFPLRGLYKVSLAPPSQNLLSGKC